MNPPEPRRRMLRPLVRTLAALLVGCGVAWLIYHRPLPPGRYSDFDQPWLAAQALVNGDDPFAAVAAAHAYPLIYPLTTAITLLPLTAVDLQTARAIFSGVGAALLTYGLLLRGWWGPLLLLSFSTFNAIWLNQWSPLVTGVALIGGGSVVLGVVGAAKPTIGLILWAATPTRRAAVGALLAVLVATLILPSWPQAWLTAIRDQPQIMAPVVRPGGFLLLLAALRWRRPEARLMAAIAVVPHLANYYEAVLLFLVPRSFVEAWVLVVGSWIARRWTLEMGGAPTLELLLDQRWPAMLLCLYLPALAMVLLRPNIGDMPGWLERAVARLRHGPVTRPAPDELPY